MLETKIVNYTTSNIIMALLRKIMSQKSYMVSGFSNKKDYARGRHVKNSQNEGV